jgi:hypothetical protein
MVIGKDNLPYTVKLQVVDGGDTPKALSVPGANPTHLYIPDRVFALYDCFI